MKKYVLLAARVLTVFAVAFSLTTCGDFLKPGLGDEVDLEDPDVTIDSHRDGQYLSGQVTFEGTFADDISGESIEVSTDGGSSFSSATRVDRKNGMWSHDIDTTQLADGEYEVRVRVTDTADKTTDAKILVYFDNTAPAILVRTPQGLDSTNFNEMISVSGDAYDPFGVTTVQLELYEADGSGGFTQIALRRDQTALNGVGAGDELHDTADGTSSWAYPFDTSLYTEDVQNYRINVRAIDRAGNTRETVFHVDTLRQQLGTIPTVNDLYEAQSASSDIDSVPLADLTGASLDLTVDQEQDLPRFEFSIPSTTDPALGLDPRATGTVTDDDGVVPESIEILIDGVPADAVEADWVQVTSTSGSGGRVSWDFDLSDDTMYPQGTHTLAVRAQDIFGRSNTSQVINFSIDYGPPVLTVSTPAPGSHHNTWVDFSGTVSDGAGVAGVDIEYSTDGGTTYTAEPRDNAPADTTNYTWTYRFEDGVAETALTEGTIFFRVTGVDVAGKEVAETLQVTVDISNPSLEFLSPSDGSVVNAGVLFQGTTEDLTTKVEDLRLYDVEVTDPVSPGATPIAILGDATSGFDSSGGRDSTAYRWYKTVDTTNYQTLGEAILTGQTFTIVAQDAAGNYGTAVVSVDVDQSTDIPQISLSTLTAGATAKENVLPKSRQMSGSALDDDSVDASSLQIRLDINNDGDFLDAGEGWNAVSDQPSNDGNEVSWTHTFTDPSTGTPLPEGEYRFEMRVGEVGFPDYTDPQRAVTIGPENFSVDLARPSVEITSPPDASYVPPTSTIEGTSFDSNGMASVELALDGAPAETVTDTSGGGDLSTWSYSYSGLGDGEFSYDVTATDNYGKATTESRSFIVDTGPPDTLTVDVPVANDILTGTSFTASGAAADAANLTGIARVEIRVDANGNGDYLDGGVENWAPASGATNWSEIVGLADLGEGVRTLQVRATDGAGNTSAPLTRSFNVDQTDPTTTFNVPSSSSTAFSIDGTATDGNAIQSVVVTQRKDGGAAVTVFENLSYSSGSESWTVTDLPRDPNATDPADPADPSNPAVDTGVYDYTVTVTDAVGKTYQTSATTTIDLDSPTVAIGSPGNNDQLLGSSYIISGSAGDVGTGVSSVEYRIDVGNDGTFTGSGFEAWTPVAGTNSWSATVEFDTGGGSGLGEGEHELFLRATDNAGNASPDAGESVVFYVDQAAPTISNVTPATANSFQNAEFNLTGDLSDSNALATLVITQSKNGGSAVTIEDTALSGSTGSLDTGATANLPRDPSAPSTTLFETGEYTYVVTVTDTAGRTSQLTRTVTVDTTPPSISFSDPIPSIFTDDTTNGNDGYTVNGTVDLKGTTTDNQAVTSLTTQVGTETAVTESNRYSFTRTIDTTDYASFGHTDGSYLTVEVVAEDAAGNSTTETYTMYVDQASDAPTLDLTNLDETVNTLANASTNLLEFNAEIVGTASDDDSVAADQVLVQVDLNGDDDYQDSYDLNGDGDFADTYEDETRYWLVSTPPGADGTQVSFRHDLTSLPEGKHKFRIQVADINGKTFTSNDVYFVIDKSAPIVENILPANGSGTNSDFNLTGDISDTAGLKDLDGDVDSIPDVEWSLNGVDYRTVASDAPGPASSTTFTIPVALTEQATQVQQDVTYRIETVGNTDWTSFGATSNTVGTVFTATKTGTTGDGSGTATLTGTQNFYVRATDIYDKTNVKQIQILVDTTAPTVSYLFPSDGTSVNGLVTVRGTASDTNQVTDVEYSLDFTDDGDDTNDTWTSMTGDLYSWGFSLDTRSYADGPFDIYVRSTDSAGNVAPNELLGITIDQASDFPVVDLVNLDESATAVGDASSNLLETNAKVQGTVTDDDWVDASSLEISIDGGAFTNVQTVGSSSTSVSFEHPLDTLNDGVHDISFRVSDTNDGTNNRKAGLTAVTTTTTAVYFSLDKSNPVVVVDDLANTFTTGPVTLTGTVTDGNVVTDVQVSTDGGGTYADTTGNGNVTITDNTDPSSVSWEWTGDLSGKPEGPFTIKVKGVDEFGKESIADQTITVDQTGPVMSISTPGTGETVNGPLNISGSASETYGFDRVEMAFDADGDATFTSDAEDTDWFTVSGTYAWSYELDTTSKADGTYTVYVRGVDAAGNETATPATREFTISQASDAPTISLSTLTVGETAENNLLPTSLQMSGTASDDDAIDATSLEIRIDANNDGDYNDGGVENWNLISGQPAIDANVVTWSHTFSGLTDGVYNFEMRVGDINFANDYTDTFKATAIGPVDFSVDTALPSGSVTNPAQGAFEKDPGTGTITFTGTASDANGVQSVEISVDGGTAQSATNTGTDFSTWSYDYTIADEGQVSFQVIITDVYGKIRTLDRYFTVDTVAPTLTYTEPTTGATVNGALSIRGTTTETNQVSQVYLWVGPDGDPVPGDPATGDWTDWTALSGTFNWSELVDTTAYTDQSTYDVHVHALDNAGNLSSDTVLEDLYFDQSTDDPVISISNLSASTTTLLGSGDLITGTVTDDDTVDASTIQISFDGGTNWTNVSSQGTSSSNVSWSHNPSGIAESASAYSVQVRASDVGDALVAPQTTTTASYDVAIDRSAPTVAAQEISYEDRYDATTSTIPQASLSGALINNSFTLVVQADDDTALQTVEVSENDGTSYSATTDNGDGTYDYLVSIDTTGNGDDGTFPLTMRATDVWGRQTTAELTVVIDTTEPSVSYLEPSDGANVNGQVTVRGSAFDANAMPTIEILGGIDNAGGGSPETFTNGGTVSSWSTQFDASLYENTTYSYNTGDANQDGVEDAGETWTSIWAFPLNVTVYDEAGNKTTASRTVNLDPEGDKPVVVASTLQPDATPSPYDTSTSVSGTIVMQSSVTDDDGAAFVRIYADLNDDGDYNDSFAYDLNGDNDTADPFETESNYLEVPVSNGVWSALVNENSEFGETIMNARGVTNNGYMRFFVVPYDVNGLAGDPVVSRVYIDANAPEILNLNQTNGALVNGSVSLDGTIRDDAALDPTRIKISFDGGTSYEQLTVTQTGSNPYTYDFTRAINTLDYFPDGDSGSLDVSIRVTDETFKQSTVALSFNVDNARPEVLWDDPATLPFVGPTADPVYPFYGNNSTLESQNQLFGSATDSGLVSGISRVEVYFLKGGDLYSPVDGSVGTTSNTSFYNQSGTQDSIPYPDDGADIITIDNRIEQGQFDQTADIGDFDGFQESLKAKTGYDEWYAFFDTTVLPDGPLDVYFIGYDEAGNASYGIAAGQIANNPPSIPTVDVAAQTLDFTDGDTDNDRAKVQGTIDIVINSEDAEGIQVSDFALRATRKLQVGSGGSIGAEDTGFTEIAYSTTSTPALVTSPPSGAASPATATLTLDTTAYESGFYYLFQAEARDTDGNTTTQDFYVWVNNSDVSAPAVTIGDFTQSSVDGVPGHVDESGNSNNDAADSDGVQDADLSGTVSVTGTVYDDTSVNSVDLAVSTDGGTSWTDIGSATIGAQLSGDAINGYTYAWSFAWDTSTIAEVAREDVILRARGSDGTNTTDAGLRPTKIVDVVPYITDILTGFDSGLLAYGKRSALGRYPVTTGSTITVEGYNLPGTAANSVTVGGTALTPASGSTTTLSLDLGATTSSGELIVTTNGVQSVNHINNNSLSQNQEDNLFNDSLDDDRNIAFWDLRSHTSLTNKGGATMRLNAAGTGVDWLYDEGGNYLRFTDGAVNGNSYMTNGFSIESGDFAYNDNGTLMWIYLHNATWTSLVDWDWFGSVQWGRDVVGTEDVTDGTTAAYNWNLPNLPRLGLGNMSFVGDPEFGSMGNVTAQDSELGRYQDLRMVVDGGDTLSANHVAYRDVSASARGIVYYGFQAGTTATQTTPLDGTGSWYANISKTITTDKAYQDSGNTSQVATGIKSPADRRGVITQDNATYFDLAVTSTGTAVATWYDADTGSLKLAYNETPMTDATAWVERTNPVATGGGAHVTLEIGPDDAVHLAYLDAGTGYLNYSYLPAYDTADGNIQTVLVDALLSNGQFNGLTVRDFGGGDYRPVISTYSTSYADTRAAVRVAWPTSSVAALADGADGSNVYTGAWEVSFVPAATLPGASKTFIESADVVAGGTEEVIVGFNGTYIEEASYLGPF